MRYGETTKKELTSVDQNSAQIRAINICCSVFNLEYASSVPLIKFWYVLRK